MSNKNLLNESQVRHFMKLAKLEPLSPGFVHGLTEKQGAVDKEDEHLGAKDGPEKDKKQSMKDRRKEMRGEDRAEGDDPAAVEERRQTRPPGGGPGGGGTSHGRSSETMPDTSLMREEDELEAELGATEAELGAEDDVADEEGAELDDLEGEVGGEGDGRMVSVDDFLAALETALETAMGDEVEVDASEMEDEEPVEDELEVDAELGAGPEDLDVDVEEELEEGVFGGGREKKWDRISKGLDPSSDPAPRGEEEEAAAEEFKAMRGTETAAQQAAAARKRRPRRDHSSGMSTGMRIGGITAEGQDDLVEQITKRVAARILKTALRKK